MDMDDNHMGLDAFVSDINDIAMLDGGNDSQAFASTPDSDLAPTFDENDLSFLENPKFLDILARWIEENGDVPIQGLIGDTPTQTQNPSSNSSFGNDEHMQQLEMVQAGLEADPDNTEMDNLEVDFEEDMTLTQTTVNVTAPAPAQGNPPSLAIPVPNPAVMFGTNGNPTPRALVERLPPEVWNNVVGLLSVPDALRFYKSWVLGLRFDFVMVAKSHPRLFINSDLVTRSEAYVQKTDVPSRGTRIANPLGLTYSELIADARASGNFQLKDDLTFHRMMDEMKRQSLSSGALRAIIQKVFSKENAPQACYHCLGGGEMTFQYWGLILCASCGKAVLDENRKYSFSNLTKLYIWANPKWEPWLEPAFRRSLPRHPPRGYRDATYRPDQVMWLIREQQPGATIETLERGMDPNIPRAVLEENLAKYLYSGAVIERVVRWYKDGPKVLANPLLDKVRRSWVRVIMLWGSDERENIRYLTDLVKATRRAKNPPAIVVDAREVKKKWAVEKPAKFLLWFLESKFFLDRVVAFGLEYRVFFKRSWEHRYHDFYAAEHWMQPVVDHIRPTYIDPMEWPRLVNSAGIETDAEDLWAWSPRWPRVGL